MVDQVKRLSEINKLGVDTLSTGWGVVCWVEPVWDMEVRADTVEWPLVKACWFVLILKLDLLSWSWSFSITFSSCGRKETWRKSLYTSVGGRIFGMGADDCMLVGGGIFALNYACNHNIVDHWYWFFCVPFKTPCRDIIRPSGFPRI
jgi:hypothetical protein